MKYLIFSDLHGSASSIDKIIDVFEKFKCDKMICLGDVLYHGPRNDLPEGYNPKYVITKINAYSEKIICIQGNCDAEVDQMVLNFPLVKSETLILNNLFCHLEHGHHLDKLSTRANIIFYGHTHISEIRREGDQVFVNPGSITIPKNNTSRSYMILDNNELSLYDFNDVLLKKENF